MSENTASPPSSSVARQVLGPGMVGNVLEWYDFALYGYLAPVIARLFFPSDDALTGLIQTYAVFAIGFLARPVGGALFGFVGDRFGRRTMLSWSIAMMALPTFLVGTLPTHQDIGVFAPVLLIVLRLLQGMSSGGEYSGSVTFLVEHAAPNRRGLYGGLAQSSAMIGGLMGAAVGWLVTDLMPADALDSWGWRLPFFSGILVGAFGLWIRIGIPDSPVFQQMKDKGKLERRPFRAALAGQKRAMAFCVALNWAASAGYFVIFTWFVGYMSDVIGLPLHVALAIGTAGLVLGLACTVGMGYLADRIGHLRVLTIALSASMLLAVPLLLLTTNATVWAMLAAQLALAVLISGILGTLPAVFVSLFASHMRCTAFSVSYNLSVAIFGGTAPLVATGLIQVTGWSIAPGLYLSTAMLIGLIAVAFLSKQRA